MVEQNSKKNKYPESKKKESGGALSQTESGLPSPPVWQGGTDQQKRETLAGQKKSGKGEKTQ